MRPSPSVLSSAAHAVPRYRSPAHATRLPPPKLPLFRSVVAHPPAPFAVEAHGKAKEAVAKQAQAGKEGDKDAKASAKAKGKKVRLALALSPVGLPARWWSALRDGMRLVCAMPAVLAGRSHRSFESPLLASRRHSSRLGLRVRQGAHEAQADQSQ